MDSERKVVAKDAGYMTDLEQLESQAEGLGGNAVLEIISPTPGSWVFTEQRLQLLTAVWAKLVSIEQSGSSRFLDSSRDRRQCIKSVIDSNREALLGSILAAFFTSLETCAATMKECLMVAAQVTAEASSKIFKQLDELESFFPEAERIALGKYSSPEQVQVYTNNITEVATKVKRVSVGARLVFSAGAAIDEVDFGREEIIATMHQLSNFGSTEDKVNSVCQDLWESSLK